MFRDILSGSRAIFIGLVFFVLIVGSSLLYSWHVHRTTNAELAETQRKVQPLENKNEAHTAADTVDTSAVDFEHAGTDVETDDAQMSDDTDISSIDEASEFTDVASAFLPDDFVSEEASAEDVPVSPHGFGPYPKIPTDFPFDVNWSGNTVNSELLSRVMIKAWTQGDRFLGGAIDSAGKIHLNYPRTVYVKYDEEYDDDGTLIGTSRLTAGGGDVQVPPHGADFPSDVRVLDYDSQAIDPYTYLNLP